MDDKDQDRIIRSYRALKTVGKSRKVLLKKGGGKVAAKLGSKANVVTAAIDAVVSTIDAIQSYTGYKKEKEITKQFNITIKAEKKRLLLEKKELKVRIGALQTRTENEAKVNEIVLSSLGNIRKSIDLLDESIKEIEREEVSDIKSFRNICFKFEKMLNIYKDAKEQINT